eukprot:s2663_g14.t1
MQVEMEEVQRPTLPETEAMSEFSAALQSLFQVQPAVPPAPWAVHEASEASGPSLTATWSNSTLPTPRCDNIWGLSKLTWVLICDMLALTMLMLCIPFLLQMSRRRPYGAPLLDFGRDAKAVPGSPHADFLCCVDAERSC